MIWLSIVGLLIGLVVMYKSSDWVIEGSIGISKAWGVKAFAIGFIFISLSTSFPELFVAILASIKNDAGLALGNIFGSNLSNITVILGLTIILGGTIYLTRKEVVDLIELMFITTLIPLILIQRGELTLIHSMILIALFGFYVYKVQRENKIMDEVVEKDYFNLAKNIVLFLIAISILLAGTEIMVRSAIALAQDLSLSTTLIGITIVAIGTSLPELFVGIRSVKRKEYGLALGNLFGSGIVNFTLVLGALALFSNVPIEIGIIGTSIPYLIVATMGVWYIISKKEELKIWVGIALIFLYIAFVFQELGLFSFIGL